LENQNVEYYIFGHFGNSHLHANLLPTNEYEYNMAQNIYEKLMLKAIELGGTISAEHGIGKLKNTYFRQMISEENYKRMIDIKFQLDKYNLLCRGNIF